VLINLNMNTIVTYSRALRNFYVASKCLGFYSVGSENSFVSISVVSAVVIKCMHSETEQGA
jgi:hypothetical protein